MLRRLASMSYHRRRVVLAAWLALLVGITAISQSVGDAYSQKVELSGSDSQAAFDLLARVFPDRAGLAADVVVRADAGVADPSVQQRLESLFAELEATPAVATVLSPYAPGIGAFQVAEGGEIAFATLQFANAEAPPEEQLVEIEEIVAASGDDDLQVELGGNLFANRKPPDSEIFGLMGAVVILLFAFGSVLAMGLPILTALGGIGIGFAAVALLSNLMSVPEFSTQLAAMIGIGVGIDYALFIVTRYRQGLRQGHSPESAVITAIDTAGRAVLFAGCTVVISLSGMFLMGIDFVKGLAVSSSIVVFITMAASVTLLPAILGFVGNNIDKLSLPGAAKREAKSHRGGWWKWSRFLQRHPWPFALLGFLLLGALALPVFDIRLGSSDASSSPTTETTRRAYDLLSEGFGPGANGRFLVAAELDGPEDLATLARLSEAFLADPGVASATPPVPNAAQDAAIISVQPTTRPQAVETVELLERLRGEVIPSVVGDGGPEVHVGGLTAAFEDMAVRLQERLPLFIGAVLALSFILLLIVFRSVLVPLKAVIMNLLSIGAAYGLLVAVFQWGWGASLIGVGGTGPIESFVPMMLFAILFGLSMDYEVFLLSRIKEEYDRTGDNGLAVADGLSATARVITAAAAIMVMVFGAFVLDANRIVKAFGLGMSVAIFLDATVVRMVLVPATMELLGKANWWFPKWLSWLPAVHVEGSRGEPAVGELDTEIEDLLTAEEATAKG